MFRRVTRLAGGRLRGAIFAVIPAVFTLGCTGSIGSLADQEEGPRGPGGPGGPGGGGAPGAGAAPGSTGSTPGSGGSSSDPGSSAGDPVKFACDASKQFSTPAMRRLTKRQYVNTVTDLVKASAGDADAKTILTALAPSIAIIPEETRKQLEQDLHGSYRRLDQDVGQAHVEGWYGVATELGVQLTSAARLERVVGRCATDGNASNDRTCLDDFVRSFGERAFRRPLADADMARARAFYGPTPGVDPDGLADVIAGILSQPDFLYLIEHGAEERTDKPGVFRLDAFELASRLSYHFWETSPDAELFDAARTGALTGLAEYEEQLDRLFSDSRTRTMLREFVRDWLKLEDLSDLTRNVGNPLYDAFAGDDSPTPALRTEMIDEALDMVDYFTWTSPGTLEEIMTTDASFAKTADLAGLYGVPVWSGTGTPPSFPGGERPGLFTRGAFLATGTAMTRPIMRGVFMRRNVLCDDIPPPPDNAAANPPQLSKSLSTRQVVEQLTQVDGTACQGCHGTVINPLGFAFEGFDALGRLRTEQTLFDDQGTEVASIAVDTNTVPKIRGGDADVSTGPADLVRLAIASGKPQACLARHYFRFSFGRWEDTRADGCVLETMRQALETRGGLRAMLRDVAALDAFRERTFD
jgi:hypothetical protein